MRYASLATAMAVLFSTGLAMAGTKVQGNIVGANGGADPTVDAKSKFKFSGKGDYQLGLKGITDSAGNPAAVTTGTTPDVVYMGVLKGVAGVVAWELNIPISITKAGQTKVKGSAASLLTLTPPGTPIGVLGVEVHEPVPAGPNVALCTALLAGTGPSMIAGVHLPALGTNPCASGAIVGISGVVTGN